ncbi:MAG: GyrI-like domain-containing protein [Ignavibacteriaceae bacterium]
MDKLDLTKEYKNYYLAKTKPELVKFDKVSYLTIKGKGEPAEKEFLEKTSALYPVAYGVKKICKNQHKDFGVPKLEGLWWVESNKPALTVPRTEWFWKLLIRMPNFVDKEILEQAIKEVTEKKKLAIANEVKFETINEGDLVSVLHIGSYATEPESIAQMEKFIAENKLSKNGLHHEIYLSDPNKTEPDKLKTILRQPVK